MTPRFPLTVRLPPRLPAWKRYLAEAKILGHANRHRSFFLEGDAEQEAADQASIEAFMAAAEANKEDTDDDDDDRTVV